MTTRHVSGQADFYAQLAIGMPGDTFKLHAGVYGALDTYVHRLIGGSTWGTRTRIEAYQRAGQPRDKVIIAPTTGFEFGIRLAHPSASNLELVGLEIDGGQTMTHAAKITNYGQGLAGASYVRFTDCEFHSALHSGIMVTNAHHIEFFGGLSSSNGWDASGTNSNKDHGVYLGGGSWFCTLQDFDTFANAAYGISEYGGELPGNCGDNRVIRGFHHDTGRLALRSGVLLSGLRSRAERVMSTKNQYGVHVYHTARQCTFSGYLESNHDGRFYIDPGAEGCAEVAC